MLVRRLWLTDFRSYAEVDVGFAEGLTAVLGPNGAGKTNLLEALGWLATLGSFRGVPTEALVRVGAGRAVVRAEGVRDGRELLVEAEIVPGGRNRIQVNRQRLHRAVDLLGALRVSVFSPDDLALVKGGPSERRRFLDDTLVAVHPRHGATRAEVDRVLRQRNALLRQVGGRLDESAGFTLDVWDSKLAAAGDALVAARAELTADLVPVLRRSYAALSGAPGEADGGPNGAVDVTYQRSWTAATLAEALAASRTEELRRGITLVGPHRDELLVTVGGMPARTHASQGEQRCLALALRLAAHEVATVATGSPPVLLLDDVFSELDPERSDALLASLPPGQTVLTTASGLPPGAVAERVLQVEGSTVRQVS